MFAHQVFFSVKHSFSLGEKTKNFSFWLSDKRTTSLPKREWGRGTALVLFWFQDVWLNSAFGHCSYSLMVGSGMRFSIQSAFHCIILLLCYNLYQTVILHNLYRIIYLERLSCKENKGFGARYNKWVKQFHHFTNLFKHHSIYRD